jgi:hypothetical protein
VQDSPFFTVKLKVKMLPCIIMFVNGVAVDRVVGFEELGGKDDFSPVALERRLRWARMCWAWWWRWGWWGAGAGVVWGRCRAQLVLSAQRGKCPVLSACCQDRAGGAAVRGAQGWRRPPRAQLGRGVRCCRAAAGALHWCTRAAAPACRSIGAVVDEKHEDESEDEELEQRTSIRRGINDLKLGPDDEDSDFE